MPSQFVHNLPAFCTGAAIIPWCYHAAQKLRSYYA